MLEAPACRHASPAQLARTLLWQEVFHAPLARPDTLRYKWALPLVHRLQVELALSHPHHLLLHHLRLLRHLLDLLFVAQASILPTEPV